MNSWATSQLDRSDRHVRRSYVRIGDRASRHRVAYWIEEGLRLASLPGEDEGRVYYFRCLSLPALPANASRKLWMDRLEHALGTLAAQAVHGNDPRASSANAVYFHNYQEALETLLRRTLRCEKPEWFWSSVVGSAQDAGQAIRILAILELLRQQPIPPGAVAEIIFSAVGASDPVALLSAIPSFTLRDWLREFDRTENISADASPLRLPKQLSSSLQQAAQHFGWGNLRVVWMASLAILCVSPSALTAGTAVKRARSTLRQLETAQLADRLRRGIAHTTDKVSSLARITPSHQQLIFHDGDGDVGAILPSVLARMSARVSLASLANQESAEATHSGTVAAPALLGEPTLAAGLYFLLNALRQLRLPAALESCPALVEAGFVASILKRLADHAGVSESDQILCCLRSEGMEFSLSSETLAAIPSIPDIWPHNLAPPRHKILESEYLLRVWTVAVRRWCWRMGRITVREIVNRNGRVWLTRTDLDVTLPLAKADVRIRRIGLDIDPGWLPWFGKLGRIVRFHYRDRALGNRHAES
jgi:hypothetical protein